jgi:hypothetical protein
MSTTLHRLTPIIVALTLASTHIYTVNAQGQAYEYLNDFQSPQPESYRLFGTAISLWGDGIAISEPGSPDPAHNHTGRVYIMDLTGNPVTTLKPPHTHPGSNFGISMATGDEFIVVGESNAEADGKANAGAAHIYDAEGTHITTLRSPDPYENASFGVSLAAHGDLIVIGEPGPYGRDGNITGKAYVFDSTGNLLHALEQPQRRLGNYGLDVAISATAIIVGEPHAVVDHDAGKGKAHIYDLNGNLKASIDSPSPGRDITNFGWAVDVGEDIAVVGEVLGDAGRKAMAGVAYIYSLDGRLIQGIQSPTPCAIGAFSNDVTICGTFIAVSEPRGATPESASSGCVHLYNLTGGHLLTIPPPQGEETSYFGFPLDAVGDTLVTGDLLTREEGKVYAGKVYAYRINLEPVEGPAPTPTDTLYAFIAGAAILAAALALWLTRMRGR